MKWRAAYGAVAVAAALALVSTACSNAGSSKATPSTSGGTVTTFTGTNFNENDPVDAPGVSSTEIHVASITSITSVLGGQDGELNDGIDAYFGYINAKGGIYGRQLKLTKKRDDIEVNNANEATALLAQDNAYAAFIATDGFSGAKQLAAAGIPTFGWNINAEWAGPKNFFPNVAPVCFSGCPLLPHMLPTIVKATGKHKVAVIAYSVPQAAGCLNGANATIKKFGSDVDASIVYSDGTIPFGNTDWSAQVSQMKQKGADFLVTCTDGNADVAIAKEMARQQILDKVTFYHANLYNADFVKANAANLEGGILLAQITAVEQTPVTAAQKLYLDYAHAHNVHISELTMQGWIAAQEFVDALKATGPHFTWANLISAWNQQKWYTAGGWLPAVDWTKQHTDPAKGDQYRTDFECGNFLKVEGGKLVPFLAKPGKPWICFDGHKLDTWQTPTNVSFDTNKPFTFAEAKAQAQG
jgi:ABC-type branched-subunit amino acid transport system substrate-binding protein